MKKRDLFTVTTILLSLFISGQVHIPGKTGLKNMNAWIIQKWHHHYLNLDPPVYSRQAPLPDEHIQTKETGIQSHMSEMPVKWKEISRSMNALGVTINNSKPLQYNDSLRAISFVHRKSPDFVPRPLSPSQSGQTGAIVGVFSIDWGETWDTTLLWNNLDYHGRYPQGAIYNPVSSKCVNGAFMVATGPVTQQTGGWMGSYFAMKELDMPGGPKNSDSVSSNVQHAQYIANTAPYPHGKFDFPSYDFTITRDGVVRSLGILVNDINATGSMYGWKGASIIRGTFMKNTLYWEADTIIPDVYTSPGGALQVSGTPHMCWNEDGSVGFVWFIGVRNPRPGMEDTLCNMGFQPIVYKTTDGGNTWTELPRINFNDNSGGRWDAVFGQMFAVRNDTFGIPFFNITEGVDGIVDRNNRLHIVTTVLGTASKHPDSLGFTYLFTHQDGQRYNYRHTTGLRPFIFDFTETNTGWSVMLIDSMASEAPGVLPNQDGYGDNPWNEVNGRKLDSEARFQLSRSIDGKYIIFTWTESDSAFTFQNHKWNNIPNVMARMAVIDQEQPNTAAGMTLHPKKINITSPSGSSMPPMTTFSLVQDKAANFFVSPKAIVLNNEPGKVALGLPVTVSNNNYNPMRQDEPVTHWYLTANLDFDLGMVYNIPAFICDVNVREFNRPKFAIYPNPTSGSVNIHLLDYGGRNITVTDQLGRIVQTIHIEEGHDTYYADLQNLANGLYFLRDDEGGYGYKIMVAR